jgi:GT2 family glycosyltransferase
MMLRVKTVNEDFFSVVIPTFQRKEKLQDCLQVLLASNPSPKEILVHIDTGDTTTERILLEASFSHQVRWIKSQTRQGPGGGRNRLIQEAKYPLIASFDDDSWPLDSNYFQIAAELFASHPQAAVLSAQEIRPNSLPAGPSGSIKAVSCFQNCACLIRREAFLQTRGYLPLRYAYGMEEADVALQLLDRGWQILEVPQLRVFHNTELAHHASSAINAAHITNIALRAYLRYPVAYWPLGIAQVFNRVKFAVDGGRYNGILPGLGQIPLTLWKYRKQRSPVKGSTIALSRQLAR